MSIAGRRSSLGDEYQLRIALHWLIRLLEDDTIDSIQVNSTGLPGEDYSVTVDDIVILYKNGDACFIQAKKNQTDHKAWSFSDKVLKDELCKARDLLESKPNSKVKFYSRSLFGDLASLVENCGFFPDYLAFHREADKNQRESLKTLGKILGRTEHTTYSLVRKISFGSPQGFEEWDHQNKSDLERLVTSANLAIPILERYLETHETNLRDSKYVITRSDVLALLVKEGLSSTAKLTKTAEIKLSSESLLREIANTSLDEHQRVFGLESSNQVKEIVRDVHPQLLSLLDKSSAILIGLKGASGTGKSTLLRQIGRDLNHRGDIAIWISDKILESSLSLQELLLKTLKRYYPSLNENAGIETIRIILSSSCKLYILVDDINRSSNPFKLLDFIETLASSIEFNQIKFIVPLWLGQLAANPKQDRKRENPLWESIELSTYSVSEKLELSGKYANAGSEQVRQLIEALNGDPFLCGVALENEEPFFSYTYSNVVENIFIQFLQHISSTVKEITFHIITLNECTETIDRFIEFILKANNPEPAWEDISNALGYKRELLRSVAITNRLGWIDQKDGLDFWRWKHDKIRDALVGRWLASNIIPQVVQGTLTGENQEFLSNPGLAEAWAFSLAFIKKSSIRKQVVEIFAKYQPLVLTESLRLNLFPNNHDFYQLIAGRLRETLTSSQKGTRTTSITVEQLILGKLAQTNNCIALEATEGLQDNENIWAARFRNGDVSAAIAWINSQMLRGWFLPKMVHPFFEQALDRFLAIYASNRHDGMQKIMDAMGNLETSVAAITLAGYLAWSELAEPAWNVWCSLSGTQKLIATVPTIWALSRCGDPSMQSKLEETLLFTSQLRYAADQLQERDGAGYVPKGIDFFWRINCQLFEQSLRWSITPLAAATWVKAIDRYSEIHKWKWDWLYNIDYPIAVEAYVRYVANKTKDDKNHLVQMIWSNNLSEGFHDPLRQIGFQEKAYENPATCQSLWKIVESELDVLSRLMAFLLWKRGATVNDLERLQKISSTNQIFDHVLKVRLKLRDESSAKFLIQKLQSHPRYWCPYVPFLQNVSEVFDVFINTFDAALEVPEPERGSYRLNSVAKYLSVERVRELIRKKRELLINSPQTWLALWCSDVPEALKLVQESMIQSNPDSWYLFFFPSESFHNPISPRMLDALIPVLKKHSSIRECIAERAADAGFGEWVHEHLPDVVMNLRIRYSFPSAEDISKALTEAVEKASDSNELILLSPVLHPIRSIFRRRDTFSSVFDIQAILKAWLSSTSNTDRLTLIAKLLAAWGDSRDIDWWQKVRPVEQSACAIWENTLYILKRRRWHTVNEYTAMF